MHTGSSRTSVQRNHALITPESHVPLQLPGWEDAEVVVDGEDVTVAFDLNYVLPFDL